MRLWLLLLSGHAFLVTVVSSLVGELFRSAFALVGATTVSSTALAETLRSPLPLLHVTTAVTIASLATLAWFGLSLAVARSAFSGETRVLAVSRAFGRALFRWTRRPFFLLVVPLCGIAPLLGVSVLSPVSGDLRIPPFISREFLKVPMTGAYWVIIVIALAVAVLASIMLLTWASDRRPGLSAITSRGHAVSHVTALLVVAMLAGRAPDGPGFVRDASAVVGALASACVLEHWASGVHEIRFPAAHQTTNWTSTIAALALVCIAAVMVSPTASPSRPTTDPPDPLVIAHRGFDRGGPENTISGLEAAVAQGADLVEMDVQQTADGGLVASHDTNLTVLAGVDRNIYEMTTAEVTRTSIEMNGNRDVIPTMAAYVQRAQELDVPLLMELKVTGHEVTDLVPAVLAELDRLGAADRNLFHSLEEGVVRELERVRPTLRTGLTLAMIAGQLPAVDCDFFVVEQTSVTRDMIDTAHAREASLYAWTVNDDRAIGALLSLGVDGIVTDRPESPVLRSTAAK